MGEVALANPPLAKQENVFHKKKPVFKKTTDQVKACDMLADHKHVMMYGGSRSGKTTIGVRNVVIRAFKAPSRHLLCRFRFNHAKTSLWNDTIPKVIRLCDMGRYKPKYNNSDHVLEFKIGFNQTSQIWLGGVDDKDRVEKILGNEYSTIYANECSQIAYGAITTLRTRLAENVGLKNKFYYDCNPPSKKHWTYQEFIMGKIPGSHDPSQLDLAYLLMNPGNNLANLPDDYIAELEALPKRERERFLLGKFLTEVEGALWTDEMISWACNRPRGEVIKTVIGVDPSTTNNPGSDECGIVVVSMDEDKDGIVEADYTIKDHPAGWAKKVIKAYEDYGANYIVAESNQGGEMVKEVLEKYAGTNQIKVKLVHASKGKFARADPVAVLYERGRIAHRKHMLDLEEEMTEWVPGESSCSPNRIDALVWACTDLFKLGKKAHIG